MNYILIVAILLVFCLIAFGIGHNVGFRKGANKVLDEWRMWLNDYEEEEY